MSGTSEQIAAVSVQAFAKLIFTVISRSPMDSLSASHSQLEHLASDMKAVAIYSTNHSSAKLREL
jgi:hypothetical protein